MRLATPFEEIGDFSGYGLKACLPAPDADVWDVWRFRQQAFAVHCETRSIAFRWCLRAPRPGDVPRFQRETYADPGLLDAAERCAAALEDHYGGYAFKLILAELPTGGQISPHVDLGPSIPYFHRCHVVAQTNPEVEFWIDGTVYHFTEGMAYDLDNTRTHAVINRGATPRVHLICDVLVPAPPGR